MHKIYETHPGNFGSQPYYEIERLLRLRLPFGGSSMSAFTNTDGEYVVLSYNTVIAVAKGDDVVIADNLWGPTSGRHINLCKRCLP